MEYEFEPEMESQYRASLIKSFRKNLADGYFPFMILDCINNKLEHYEEVSTFAKQKGFQVSHVMTITFFLWTFVFQSIKTIESVITLDCKWQNLYEYSVFVNEENFRSVLGIGLLLNLPVQCHTTNWCARAFF